MMKLLNNKDFLKDSFYLHSQVRAKRTDQMNQMSLIDLIDNMKKEEEKKESSENTRRSSSQSIYIKPQL